MNYTDAISGVESGSQCAYLPDWPTPLSIVLLDGAIHKVADTDLGVFEPNESEENAMNWELAFYDGDLPAR